MFIIMRYSEICDGSYDVYSSGYSSKQQIVGYAESKQECLEWINNTTNGMMDFTEIQFVEDKEDPDFLNAKGLRHVHEQYKIIQVNHI